MNSENDIPVFSSFSGGHGNPLRAAAAASAAVADCREFENLVEGLNGAEAILADKAHDTDAVADYAAGGEMKAVVLPKPIGKTQRDFDECLYKHRYLAENAFPKLKRWRAQLQGMSKKNLHFWLLFKQLV